MGVPGMTVSGLPGPAFHHISSQINQVRWQMFGLGGGDAIGHGGSSWWYASQ